jgi:hypothetical protein
MRRKKPNRIETGPKPAKTRRNPSARDPVPRRQRGDHRSKKCRPSGAAAGRVSCPRPTRTTHEQWGWRAPSRGLMAHLVKQRHCTGYRHGEGTHTSSCATYAAPECQLVQSQYRALLFVQFRTISRLAQQICAQYVPKGYDTAADCWRWRRLTTPPPRLGPFRDRRSLPEHGADRAVPLGPHLDPLGPLLGQPHDQRHAGRHAVQFGVVLVAALELFA